MSRRKYPRFGGDRKLQGDVPTCGVPHCTDRPVRFVDMQVNWFRGDDETIPACEGHLNLARRNAEAFMQAMIV